MRQIILTTALLTVPFAVTAAEPEPAQPAEPEYGQQSQQQTQQAQDQRASQQQGQQAETQRASQQQGQQAETQRASQQQDPQMQGQSASQQQGQQSSQQQGGAEPQVARAQFTTEVQNREPVDEISDTAQVAEQESLYFFTEIKDGAGQTVTHRWTHDGEVMAEVPLQVGSDSWRTWSSKELMPEWEGEWTVEVVDAQGNTLTEESVTVETTGTQTQNVGYSPDDQRQQDQQSQDQQNQEEGWQSDALPEEAGWETDDQGGTRQGDDQQQQNDQQQQDDQQTSDQDW